MTSESREEGIAHEACQEGQVSRQSMCGLEKNVQTQSVSERREAIESESRVHVSSASAEGQPPMGQGERTAG